jgi:hypothetical protein
LGWHCDPQDDSWLAATRRDLFDQRSHIGGPHLLVLGFGSGDRGGVLPEQV